MNILLFSPALLIAFIATQGVTGAIKQVSTCAIIQLLVGYPFLSTYPLEYLMGSFDMGRVFLYEWTVNWRFIPEEIFIHRGFHAILFTAHVVTLLLMVRKWWSMLKSYNQSKNSLGKKSIKYFKEAWHQIILIRVVANQKFLIFVSLLFQNSFWSHSTPAILLGWCLQDRYTTNFTFGITTNFIYWYLVPSFKEWWNFWY